MHPPRFRLRTLMVAVAAVGLTLACITWSRRRERFIQAARIHEKAGRMLTARLRWQAARQRTAGVPQAETERRLAPSARMIRNHAAMRASRYERAARYPWLPVALDLPEPN